MKKIEVFSDLLKNVVNEKPDCTAVVYNNETYTYGELLSAVDIFASDLVKMGVNKGDHVALWSMNSANWIVAYFGIIRAGGVAVLMNFGLPMESIKKQMAFSDVKFIAYGYTRETLRDPSAASKVAEALGISEENIYDIRQDFHKRIAEDKDVVELPEESDSKRTATLIFTSGTTASPKAVMQSQRGMCCNIISNWERIGDSYGEKKLIALPLFHSFGLQLMLAFLMKGATIWVTDSFHPHDLSQLIIKNQITDMTSVAALYHGIIKMPYFKEEVAHILQYCGVGGSYSSPEEMVYFYNSFPNANFICGYGQTEASTCISMHYPDDSVDKCANTVGVPLSCIDMKICDPADGTIQSVNGVGEVIVRGESLMNGYYKQTDDMNVFDEDGWMHTGDLGFVDEDGYLHITGRMKDIIIKSGENIMPSEIESKIITCNGVISVKVIGVPHPQYGESIEACIMTQPGMNVTEDMLREHLKEKLNSFMMPSHFLQYTQFPMNENGKIDQKALRKDVMERIKKMS